MLHKFSSVRINSADKSWAYLISNSFFSMLMHEWAYLRGKKLLVEPVGLCTSRFDQTAKQ